MSENGATKKPLRLGDALIHAGVITQDQLSIALKEQKNSDMPLGQLIVKLGFASDAVVRETISKATGQESIDISKIIPDDEVQELIPKEIARRYKILPIDLDKETATLTIAMSDTYNVQALDRIKIQLKGQFELNVMLAGESEIEDAIDLYYGYTLSVDKIINEIETGKADINADIGETTEYSHPLVRLVDAILADAVKRGASDIHFEPEEGFYRVRYRIDGVLKQIRSLHNSYAAGVTVRLKVLSGMNIAENRAPQDGRISLSISGRVIDFRVASQPTIYGEDIVLRILDRKKGIVPLDKLGLHDDALSTLKLMMSRPEGIILVTGPTGSGKTTTLYSVINYLASESINIMTLEDPVEYPLQMIRQTSVNEAAKLDFASGIRSMMRQDPDVILVGEIRDPDTAEMALRAAMTGHQVYSTLHTNSAVGAIPRLMDLNVKPSILIGNIIGIVAQRLVRKLCSNCKEAYEPDSIEKKILGITDHTHIYKAGACSECDYSGYKGRISLLETLKFDADIDDMIVKGATNKELTELALRKGFIPIAEDGIRRIIEGITSIDEVSRVIDLTHKLDI